MYSVCISSIYIFLYIYIYLISLSLPLYFYSYSFWEHEWSKHGTCSGLSQYDYFNDSINLIKKFGTPYMYTQAVGSTVNADDLRTAFGGTTKATLQCSGVYITGVFTCWSRDSNGHPDQQVVCPSDVQGEDTCSSDELTVVSF